MAPSGGDIWLPGKASLALFYLVCAARSCEFCIFVLPLRVLCCGVMSVNVNILNYGNLKQVTHTQRSYVLPASVAQACVSSSLVAARTGANFIVAAQKRIKCKLFAMPPIATIQYSSVFSLSLVDADDGSDNNQAHEMSSETRVAISCGHVITLSGTVGSDCLAVLKIGELCAHFELGWIMVIFSRYYKN